LDIGGSNDKRPGKKKEERLRVHETLNVAAWNVKSIGNKESELAEEIKIKGINVAGWLRWSRGSVLAFSIQVCGFKPGRSRRIFRAKKSSANLP